MTTDAHPDSYAEGYHQGFFRNLQAGREPHNCGEKTPGTASIGGLVTVGPLAVLELLKDNSVSQVQQTVRNHLFLTHPDEQLAAVADAYVELLSVTLNQGKSEDSRK